jgi:hypothetical protein
MDEWTDGELVWRDPDGENLHVEVARPAGQAGGGDGWPGDLATISPGWSGPSSSSVCR